MKLYIRNESMLRRPASPPTRGAWIEIVVATINASLTKSPPTRGAWIEIAPGHYRDGADGVAPHTGGVD